MTFPNFFILGAPKSGTTSIVHWLSSHPQVFMSPIKEPGFLAQSAPSVVNSWSQYHELFQEVTNRHKVVGEATTNYLFNIDEAAPIILKHSESPKFVVCLRNPIDMAQSLHNHMVWMLRENEKDFKKAWRLQESRKRGVGLPSNSENANLLQYGSYCRLGHQVERLLRWVDAQQVHFIFLEDIEKNPRKSWKDLMAFLSIEDDGRTSFLAHNTAAENKSYIIKAALKVAAKIKRALNLNRNLGLLTPIENFNRIQKNLDPLDDSFKKELLLYFYSDIQLLESLLDTNLDHWKN